jgi:hypothetical protein
MKTLIIGAIGIRPFLVAELIERYKDAKIITGSFKGSKNLKR